MTITNDLKIYSSGVWTSPSEIHVFDANANAFVNSSNVYVYSSGAWVEVWPPIEGNVVTPNTSPTYGFWPDVISHSANAILATDLYSRQTQSISTSYTLMGARTSTIGRRNPDWDPVLRTHYANLHYTSATMPNGHSNASYDPTYTYLRQRMTMESNYDSIISYGTDGTHGVIHVVYNVAGDLTKYKTNYSLLDANGNFSGAYKTVWYPNVPKMPSNTISYTTNVTSKINRAITYDCKKLFYPTETHKAERVGLFGIGDNGNMFATNALWTEPQDYYLPDTGGLDPTWPNVNPTHSHFSTTGDLQVTGFNLGTSENLNDFYETSRGYIAYPSGASSFNTFVATGGVVGDNGTYIRYSFNNTSVSYTSVTTATSENLNAIYLTQNPNNITTNDNIDIVVGDNGAIVTWVPQSTFPYTQVRTAITGVTVNLKGLSKPYNLPYDSVKQDTPLAQLIVGDNGKIIRRVTSTNRAAFPVPAPTTTYTTITSGTTENLHTVSIEYTGSGSTILYIFGENGTILKSINYGSTWTIISAGLTSTLSSTEPWYRGDDGRQGQNWLDNQSDSGVLYRSGQKWDTETD